MSCWRNVKQNWGKTLEIPLDSNEISLNVLHKLNQVLVVYFTALINFNTGSLVCANLDVYFQARLHHFDPDNYFTYSNCSTMTAFRDLRFGYKSNVKFYRYITS